MNGYSWGRIKNAEGLAFSAKDLEIYSSAPGMEEISVLTFSLVVPILSCCLSFSCYLFLGTYCFYLCRGVISGLASDSFFFLGCDVFLLMSRLAARRGLVGHAWQISAGADLHVDVNDHLDGVTVCLHMSPAAAEFNFTLKPAYYSTS